jgi:hypothetical protein
LSLISTALHLQRHTKLLTRSDCLSRLSSTPVSLSAASAQPVNITIAGLYPMTGTAVVTGPQRAAMARLAAEFIREDPFFNQYLNFTIDFTDDRMCKQMKPFLGEPRRYERRLTTDFCFAAVCPFATVARPFLPSSSSCRGRSYPGLRQCPYGSARSAVQGAAGPEPLFPITAGECSWCRYVEPVSTVLILVDRSTETQTPWGGGRVRTFLFCAVLDGCGHDPSLVAPTESL